MRARIHGNVLALQRYTDRPGLRAMTREEFRLWAKRFAFWIGDDPRSVANREWADNIRPHDPLLAQMYERLADATEAIRAHLINRAE